MLVTREVDMSGSCDNCSTGYTVTAEVAGEAGTSTYCETDINCERCGTLVRVINIAFTFPSS